MVVNLHEDKYYVIGGGWYGCFVADFLERHNKPYVLIEKENSIFTGASKFNQNRLHLGFHYPRSKRTRLECKEGFSWFAKTFSEIISGVDRNYYAIHKNSFIDFGTYQTIFLAEGYDIETVDSTFLQNVEGIIAVDEMYIDPVEASLLWMDRGLNILNNCSASIYDDKLFINGQEVKDAAGIIDCTWGEMLESDDGYSEQFMTLVLDRTSSDLDFDALTVMDGNFFSIYPYIENQFTLTHVKHGVLRSSNMTEVEKHQLTENIISSVKEVYPDFDNHYTVKDNFVSRKYKVKNTSADRSVKFNRPASINNYLQILSGKIDSLFNVEKTLQDFLQ